MRNYLAVLIASGISVVLAGCGHNAVTYGDGIGFDAGINPENCTASFNLRYGKILSAVTRDNVEIELSGNSSGTGEKSGAVKTDGNLKIRIGRQINGAAVDTIKAGADPEKVINALTGSGVNSLSTVSQEIEPVSR